MPKFLEDALEASAAKKGKTGRAADRYVYGAMNNMGTMHGNRETARGRAMEAKHERDKAKPKAKPPKPKGIAKTLGKQLMEAY